MRLCMRNDRYNLAKRVTNLEIEVEAVKQSIRIAYQMNPELRAYSEQARGPQGEKFMSKGNTTNEKSDGIHFLVKLLVIYLSIKLLILAGQVDQLKEENARLNQQIRTYQIIQETGRNGG